ncbi:hypothetical protein TKK_0011776 [Trichogramma kaykai]
MELKVKHRKTTSDWLPLTTTPDVVQLFEEFNKVNTIYNNIIEATTQSTIFSLLWYIYVSDFILYRHEMITCLSIMFRLVKNYDSDGKKILDTIIKKTFWFNTIEAGNK